MGSTLDQLSEVQKAAYRAVLVHLGLSPDHLSFEGTFVCPPGVCTLTSDVRTSAIKPTMIPVRNIAEMKKMAGIPDEHYDSRRHSDQAVFYPPPLQDKRLGLLMNCKDPCDLNFQMTSQERALINKAAAAYMQGHSQKVNSWEPLLNAMYFPTQITAVTGDSLVVPSGSTFVINAQNPVLNVGSITVNYGGQIQIQVNASITTQTFTSTPASS